MRLKTLSFRGLTRFHSEQPVTLDLDAMGPGLIAIVGQNGTEESRRELARPSSALIASVGYFPEKYGEMLIKLASDVVSHRKTPLALYAEHVLLHHANLKKYYPAST